MLESDEGIKLGLSDEKILFTMLLNVDGITLGLVFGTELRYLYGSSYGSNDDKLDDLLLGDSLEYTDGKLLGSDESIKLGSTDGKFIDTMLRNVDGIKLGLDI